MLKNAVLLFAVALIACSGPQQEKNASPEMKYAKDHHSFAEPNQARVSHLNFTIDVDFDKKQINGTAEYDMVLSEDASRIIFDTRNLVIESAQVDGQSVDFEMGTSDPVLGQSLTIPVSPNAQKVQITYHTTEGADALQWLVPEQTAGKEHPFLFTQSQAILARTWLPCQDSPGIRFTYSANVKVPNTLMAVMSASNPQEKNATGEYSFQMNQAIPSYLMALSVGDLVFGEIGPRTGVYAEPSVLDKGVYEFAQMEDMLVAAEKLYGKYAWDRYDVIVLPPSFPFGGMENPRLTFATPTILAGDRSLTALIAHEMAHSWSGNLVTNINWDDFWLNEGFTVYFEQRIMEEVFGREYSEMLALLSRQGLSEEVEEMTKENPEDTHLKLKLSGRDPDEGMTAIAYDKGYFFLRLVEESMGREKFDQFLKGYFTENAFSSMDTERFVEILKSSTTPEEWEKINPESWIYGPGVPENCPVVESQKFEMVDNALNDWMQNATWNDNDWSTHEWLHFINNIPNEVSVDQLRDLDSKTQLTQSGNCEIQAAWYEVAIRQGYAEANDSIQNFLVNVGRRKFLTPLYKALIEVDTSKTRAREIYALARPNYHSVSTQTMDKLLDWQP